MLSSFIEVHEADYYVWIGMRVAPGTSEALLCIQLALDFLDLGAEQMNLLG